MARTMPATQRLSSLAVVAAILSASSCLIPTTHGFVPMHHTARRHVVLFDTPEPLATQGDWQAFLDEETTGLIYYFDTVTGESRWEPPTESFPAVKLPRRKQRAADKLRTAYLEQRKLEEEGQASSVEDAVLVADDEAEKGGGGWMGGFRPDVLAGNWNKKDSTPAQAELPASADKAAAEQSASTQDANGSTGGGFLGGVFGSVVAGAKQAPEAEQAASADATKNAPVNGAKATEVDADEAKANGVGGILGGTASGLGDMLNSLRGQKPDDEAASKAADAAATTPAASASSKSTASKKAKDQGAATAVVEDKEDIKPKLPAFMGNIFSSDATAQTTSDDKVEDKQAEKKKKQKQKQQPKQQKQKQEPKQQQQQQQQQEQQKQQQQKQVKQQKQKQKQQQKEEEEEDLFDVEFVPRPIKTEIAGFVSPHPEKVRWGGEDAIFIKGKSFGVFDGVSGAEKEKGYPLYSKTLANELKKTVGFDSLSIPEMRLLLTEAAEVADNTSTGASTAIMASINSEGFLQVLNVGDSACVVVRGDRITARSREVNHFFDCPYQLSDYSQDRPKDGSTLYIELVAGDLVLMGSDGIFDNLTDDQIIELVTTKQQQRSGTLARKIVDLSRKISLDVDAKTPYAKQARLRGDKEYSNGLGGKVDDASCIVVSCK